MTDANLVQRLMRRWYLLVVGVMASVAVALLAAEMSPPVYQAAGTVLLLPPKEDPSEGGSGGGPTNPLVQGNFGGSAAFVMERVNSQDTRERILQKHPEASYVASQDASLRGPVVTFTVTDTTEGGALLTVQDLFAVVPPALSRLQRRVDIPRRLAVTSTPLRYDTHATKITSNTTRAQIAGLGLGLILTLVGTTCVDTLILRRRTRVNRRREPAL